MRFNLASFFKQIVKVTLLSGMMILTTVMPTSAEVVEASPQLEDKLYRQALYFYFTGNYGAALNQISLNRQRFNNCDFAACADFSLLQKVVNTAERTNKAVHVGNIFTADLFYTPQPEMFAIMEKHGILAVEMEAAGLYGVAAELGKKALAVFTVSDHIKTGEQTTADERENTFNEMMELTLDSIL